MQRVKRSTAVAVQPTPPAGGTPGFFAQPNPQGGVPATVPGFEWYNTVQEELVGLVLAADLALADNDPTQLVQAIIKKGLQGSYFNIGATGGTADAITATYTPTIAALTNGMTLYVRAGSANATTTPTFTPASGTIAAKQIVKWAGSALAAGDIAGGGHWIKLQYDAILDKWMLLNPAAAYSSSIQVFTLANVPATKTAGDVIYVIGYGQWEWVETAHFTGYRHPECGNRVDGDIHATPPGYLIDAVGGNMSKTTPLGSRLWAAFNEAGLVVAPSAWTAGWHHVCDNGDGTFKLPNLLGTFARAAAGMIDPDTAKAVEAGVYKADTIKSHNHELNGELVGGSGATHDVGRGNKAIGHFTRDTGTAETAPRHTAYWPRLHT